MDLDVLIFGGGAAGLWLLDQLSRRGDRVLLLEAGRLGQGQTVSSQGIIHGGLKYTLQGLLTPAAREIREMPGIWRECLAGLRYPDLSQTRLRSAACYLWRSESLRSRLGMLGARVGLHVAPQELPAGDRPAVFAGCPGPISQLEEQVIDPASFIADQARQHRCRLLKIDAVDGLKFVLSHTGTVKQVIVTQPGGRQTCEFSPRHVVFAAGAGNAHLRDLCRLPADQMQRRPLHMVLARGNLPAINGHCVDGARTRVTITTDRDSLGRTIWQVGGQLAEEGVGLDNLALLRHARTELASVLPGVELSQVEWSTYRIDRAERASPGGGRPDTATVLREGNVITAWPTKLALVPQAVRMVESHLPQPIAGKLDLSALADWPRPEVAPAPWETALAWHFLDEPLRSHQAA